MESACIGTRDKEPSPESVSRSIMDRAVMDGNYCWVQTIMQLDNHTGTYARKWGEATGAIRTRGWVPAERFQIWCFFQIVHGVSWDWRFNRATCDSAWKINFKTWHWIFPFTSLFPRKSSVQFADFLLTCSGSNFYWKRTWMIFVWLQFSLWRLIRIE